MLSGVYDVPAAECRSGIGSDVVACQLVIKQILDVLDVIAPVEVREKMSSQLKNIDFTNHPAAADPVTMRAIQKAIALIELKFTPQGESH